MGLGGREDSFLSLGFLSESEAAKLPFCSSDSSGRGSLQKVKFEYSRVAEGLESILR